MNYNARSAHSFSFLLYRMDTRQFSILIFFFKESLKTSFLVHIKFFQQPHSYSYSQLFF